MRYTFKGDGTDVGYTHYYSFGMEYTDDGTPDMRSAERFTGQEFQTQHGLNVYDQLTRMLNQTEGRFWQIDRHAENYYGWSPYASCGNNPVRITDPTGMDWVYRIVGGVYEVYYDRDITSQAEVNKKYGEKSGVTHLTNGSTLTTYDKNGDIASIYTFTNDGEQNKYGIVTDHNGNVLDNSQIVYGGNYTIFGTSDNSVNAETLHKNLFGTSYTGANNPMTYGNEAINLDSEYSYQYNPRNPSEIYSVIHDKEYDAKRASGMYHALYNHSLIGADYRLTKGNLKNMVTPGVPLKDRGRSAATATGFGIITVTKWLTKGYQTGPLTP